MLKSGVKSNRSSEIKSATKNVISDIDLGSTPVFHSALLQNGLNQTFTYNEDDWLLVADGDGKQEYTERRGKRKTALKWGQMKLFITELQFLNKYWNPKEVPNPVCVYVGAAAGNHIVFLARMFPQIEFHLYDGRDFDSRLESESNVKLFKKLFTESEVKQYKDKNNIFFISDIRSLTYDINSINNEENQRKNEEIANNDMKLQMNWVIEIKPVKAHLKFRLPYAYNWVKDESYSYLDGDVYKQAFAPHTSTECRLVPNLDLPLKNWNFKLYEQLMFYQNNVVREHVKFNNPLTGINEPISEELGLLQDFESVVFITTIREYLEKFTNVNGEIGNKHILELSKAIIEDIGSGVVNLVNLRAGLNGTLTSTIKSRIKNVLSKSKDEEDE